MKIQENSFGTFFAVDYEIFTNKSLFNFYSYFIVCSLFHGALWVGLVKLVENTAMGKLNFAWTIGKLFEKQNFSKF